MDDSWLGVDGDDGGPSRTLSYCYRKPSPLNGAVVAAAAALVTNQPFRRNC